MPEYRTAPELDRGYAVFAIRSTLFNKNDRDELRVYPSQITGGIVNRDYKYVHRYNR